MLAASMTLYFALASSLTALVMLHLHKLLRRTPLHTSSFAYQYKTLRSLWLNLPIFALTYAFMCFSLLSKKLVSFLAASASLNVPSLHTHFVLKCLYRSVIAPWTGGIQVFFWLVGVPYCCESHMVYCVMPVKVYFWFHVVSSWLTCCLCPLTLVYSCCDLNIWLRSWSVLSQPCLYNIAHYMDFAILTLHYR